MICPHCHTANRDAAKYCDECGYELPSVMPTATVRIPQGDDGAYDLGSAATLDLDREDAYARGYGDELDDALYGEGETGGLGGADDGLSRQLTAPLDGSDDPSFTSEIPLVSDEALAVRDYRAEDPAAPRKARRPINGKRIAIIAAIIAVLLAVALGITFCAPTWAGRAVPNVVGLSQVDATYAVQEAGFTVEVEEVISDEVEGVVLSTDPAAGTRAPEQTTVTLRVSVARHIPEIVGKQLEEAEQMLREAGFTNFEVASEKSDQPAGTVLSVNPPAATRTRADARITLNVAEPYRVPELAGMSQDEAKAALEAEGLVASVQRTNTEEVPEGQVVKSEPAAGSAVPSGSTVTVYVAHNRSAELVQLTRSFFDNAPTITMNGSLYEMSKVDGVTFEGGNTCSFSISVRPIQTVTWFGTQTETRYGNYEIVNGTIVWTDSNQVASIDPDIKQGS